MDSVELWVRRCAARMDEAGLFFGHGTDNALDEAAWLVLSVIGAPLDGRFDRWQEPVDRTDAAAIEALLNQRIATRQPLAYLLGEAWFCGLPFHVGPGALVPRSPIAELIAAGFQPWLGPREPQRALDLCTGGACIALAMATHMPTLRVDAADISSDALAVAERNLRLHRLAERVELVQSDLFDALAGRRYDLIVSNPPYVPAAALEALPDEYRAEPSLGLVSGDDGLELPLKLMLAAPDYMTDNASLFCEVGESEYRLQQSLPQLPLTWLEFAHGGGGVFTIGRSQLEAARPAIGAALEKRGHVIE